MSVPNAINADSRAFSSTRVKGNKRSGKPRFFGYANWTPKFMLYDRTPEIDFAADTAIGVAYLPQVLTVLCPINTACAFPMRDFVGDLGDMGSSGRDAAPRLKAPTRKPRLAVQRFQSRCIPLPSTMSHNGRYVVGNLH